MNTYAPTINKPEQIDVNRSLLILAGCTSAQADNFANRTYTALPAWVRKGLKRATVTNSQPEPRKLRPAAGELAFYINPQRFRKAA
jgi:hypothetical protein